MAEETKKTETSKKVEIKKCNDRLCPIHGSISLRGRSFRGIVIRKFPKRVVIEFDRTVYVQKYERYAKRKTKLHARLPDCMFDEINLGDYIEVMESRPISKMINFIVTKKISGEKETGGKKE